MKNPSEWDEQYVLSLPVGEFDWLEIKSRRALDLTLQKEETVKNILSKALSAFANSGGGRIVYGVGNPKPGDPLAVDDGGVNLVTKQPTTREWLEDVIPHLVDPPLTAFNVFAVTGTSAQSQIDTGRAVFIVDVGDSHRAPHQATDHIYYVRVAGKSRPASHQMVADIFGRRQYPLIDVEVMMVLPVEPSSEESAESQGIVPELGVGYSHEFKLIVTATNNGRVYAQYVNCILRIPRFFTPTVHFQDIPNVTTEGGDECVVWYVENTRGQLFLLDRFLHNKIPEAGQHDYVPILPGRSLRWVLTLRLDAPLSHPITWADYEISWQVYADNAPVRSGGVFLTRIKRIPES
jgi:hypothetical protein